MEDPRPGILSLLDLANCRIELSKSPIVLLCGGPVPGDINSDPKTLRHALVSAHTNFEVFRPEEITDWQVDGVYKNLMDFELDLASICTLVAIILESEGSIAELGAFSQLPELNDRLAVFASSELDPNSFIELGILRYIERNKDTRVKKYPWNPHKLNGFDSDFVQNVVADIEQEISALKKSQVLNGKSRSHMTVAICELLRHFIALRRGEINNFLNLMGFDEDISQNISGILFLLERFRLIKKIVYSDSVFYSRSEEEFHRIRLAGKDGNRLDPVRIKADCSVYYSKSPSERHRKQVIKTLLAGESNA